MQLIGKYFPELHPRQIDRFNKFLRIFPVLNSKVNMVSRKDMGHLEERHVLHSLAISKAVTPGPGSEVVDVGSGGGFPGIPLAILFPGVRFLLVDSIGKKIRMIAEMVHSLELENVEVRHARAEQLDATADLVVSRAVAPFPTLIQWTSQMIREASTGDINRGWVALKGGDLTRELESFEKRVEILPISSWFAEPFFSTKKIVYLKK